jgi:hypothetical protein
MGASVTAAGPSTVRRNRVPSRVPDSAGGSRSRVISKVATQRFPTSMTASIPYIRRAGSLELIASSDAEALGPWAALAWIILVSFVCLWTVLYLTEWCEELP